MTWAPDYCTLQELKSYLRITDNADDVFLALWITAASRSVDDFCGRQFGQVAAPESRTYPAVYDRHEALWVTEIDDLMDVTGLSIADSAATVITDYTLRPLNAVAKGRPYERITTGVPGPMTISGLWGWTPGSAGPTVAKAGLLLQAARLTARRDSPFGISGSPGEQGELRLLAQLDPDFRTTLKPLQRGWWAA